MVLTIPLSDVVFCSCTRAWYTDDGRCLFLWIQIRVGIVVRAADCRSAGPWFNSGWMSWFIFMTGSDNLMNHPAQRYNTISPIRTVITTITRKSVNKKSKKIKKLQKCKNGKNYQEIQKWSKIYQIWKISFLKNFLFQKFNIQKVKKSQKIKNLKIKNFKNSKNSKNAKTEQKMAIHVKK